jgi:hypothetical protein
MRCATACHKWEWKARTSAGFREATAGPAAVHFDGKAGGPCGGLCEGLPTRFSYSIRGAACRGVVKCNVAPAYDTVLMAMTAALSDVSQWDGYSLWLPLIADQVSATNGAAFGMRGIMAQNLQNSTAYADAARQYREWSQRNWQQVTDDRNASPDRKNFYVRENLGGIQRT